MSNTKNNTSSLNSNNKNNCYLSLHRHFLLIVIRCPAMLCNTYTVLLRRSGLTCGRETASFTTVSPMEQHPKPPKKYVVVLLLGTCTEAHFAKYLFIFLSFYFRFVVFSFFFLFFFLSVVRAALFMAIAVAIGSVAVRRAHFLIYICIYN